MYTIQALTWPHGTLGHVVVVDPDAATPPTGFAAGTESWYWNNGTFPSSFRLVAVPWSAPPAVSWTVYGLEQFDLSGTVPFPSVAPSGTDRFYEVDRISGSGTEDLGFFYFHGSVQDAWGLETLDEPVLEVGQGEALRFVEVTPPAASSIHVFEAE